MDQIKKVRLLKALYNVSYGSIAEELGITRNSLYNWMRGSYSLSKQKQQALQQIIDRFEEVSQ